MISSLDKPKTKTKNQKPNFFVNNISILLYTLKKKSFFSFCYLVPPIQSVKKVVEFSFTQQKTFWVLVFSICTWYFAYPTEKSVMIS